MESNNTRKELVPILVIGAALSGKTKYTIDKSVNSSRYKRLDGELLSTMMGCSPVNVKSYFMAMNMSIDAMCIVLKEWGMVPIVDGVPLHYSCIRSMAAILVNHYGKVEIKFMVCDTATITRRNTATSSLYDAATLLASIAKAEEIRNTLQQEEYEYEIVHT